MAGARRAAAVSHRRGCARCCRRRAAGGGCRGAPGRLRADRVARQLDLASSDRRGHPPRSGEPADGRAGRPGPQPGADRCHHSPPVPGRREAVRHPGPRPALRAGAPADRGLAAEGDLHARGAGPDRGRPRPADPSGRPPALDRGRRPRRPARSDGQRSPDDHRSRHLSLRCRTRAARRRGVGAGPATPSRASGPVCGRRLQRARHRRTPALG